MRSLAIVAEDLSQPLDEGFKKASAALIASIAGLGISTSVFSRRYEGFRLPAERLPANKLLIGSAFSRRLSRIGPEAILYIPEAAATPGSFLRARLLKLQSGGRPVALLSLQRREYHAAAAALLRTIKPDLALVLSDHSAKTMEHLGIAAVRVALGVDLEAFRPRSAGQRQALRRGYGITGEKVILHVGHVSEGRNLGLLAGALGPGRQLVIVSSTSTARRPEAIKAFQGRSVVFVDRFIEDVGEVYSLADCYVFPTYSARGAIELPLSVLEAMATNLPVVTTAFGGLPDIFTEGRGLFLASSDAEFAKKMELALASNDVATRDLVRDLTWDKVAGQVIESIGKALR